MNDIIDHWLIIYQCVISFWNVAATHLLWRVKGVFWHQSIRESISYTFKVFQQSIANTFWTMDVCEHFHHKGGRLQSAVAGRWKCLCTCASSQLSQLCIHSANWCLRNIVTVVFYPHNIISLACHLFNSKTAQLMMHMSHKARDVLEQTPKPSRKPITTIMQRVTFLRWFK